MRFNRIYDTKYLTPLKNISLALLEVLCLPMLFMGWMLFSGYRVYYAWDPFGSFHILVRQ
jgi:hypothetical protein